MSYFEENKIDVMAIILNLRADFLLFSFILFMLIVMDAPL